MECLKMSVAATQAQGDMVPRPWMLVYTHVCAAACRQSLCGPRSESHPCQTPPSAWGEHDKSSDNCHDGMAPSLGERSTHSLVEKRWGRRLYPFGWTQRCRRQCRWAREPCKARTLPDQSASTRSHPHHHFSDGSLPCVNEALSGVNCVSGCELHFGLTAHRLTILF